MFEQVNDSQFITGEHDMLAFWRDRCIFDKLREKNADKPQWSFLDGPITANNPMGVHHAWGRTYKDAFQRFHAMNGRRLRYQNGFDCQGLWVEVEVEKQLGLDTKDKVEAYGVANFVNACKQRVLRFAARQTEQSIRLGYWMEWDDPDELRKLADTLGGDAEIELKTPHGGTVTGKPHQLVSRLGNPQWGGSYFTFSAENNDTIWTFLKKCFQRGKIYSGFDVMPWSGRASSAYSQMEVAEGRKLTVHRAIFLKFPLIDRVGENLLVWTTTPWTLTSNIAAAVNVELDYAKVRSKRDGQLYYVAKENLEYKRLESEYKDGFGRPEWKWPDGVPKPKTLAQLFNERGGYEIEGVVKGAELIGLRYRGPFDELPAQNTPGGYPPELRTLMPTASEDMTGVTAHRIIDGGRDSKGSPHVVAGEGTGIVHTATGCGDVDFHMGKQLGLIAIAPLDREGKFTEGFGEFTGRKATDADTVDLVLERLKERDLLFAAEPYPHIYPFCWRTGDELVFRLVDEWFINMDWREEIRDVVRQTEWLPASIDGQKRELEWLANMGDWMISKKRFWGLALPIWCESYTDDAGVPQHDFEVIGSLAELKERAVEGWEQFEGNTAHRPWLDHVKIRNPKTGRLMSRVPDVGNPWLDAGIVPFSTMSFNTDHDYWRQWYPADLVLECFPGQFRNWFYSLLTMSTMMAGERPFKTLLGHRLVMNEQGKPMHKSDGTAIWFEEAAEQLGVDTIRWMFLTQDPANDLRFGTRHPDKHVTVQTPTGEMTHTAEGVELCEVTSTPAEEVRRQVLIPLWNSYAFFVNYAILDGFDPRKDEVAITERPEIDRWILSNLQVLVQAANDNFRAYNAAGVCQAAARFIDDLSNWYIRRNRRRFWRSRDAGDVDKRAAYQTLHAVLLTLTKLLAPAIPFLAERMYQNLAKPLIDAGETPESVHLCDYPQPDAPLLDESLNRRMDAVMSVVSLGRRLRNDATIRARQPLGEIKVAVRGDDAAAATRRTAIGELADIVLDELNIKSLTQADSLDELVTYSFKPNFAALGPRYGKQMKEIGGAFANPDLLPAHALLKLSRGGALTLSLASGEVRLEPGDVLVQTTFADGWMLAEEAGLQVALATTLTQELIDEGVARDCVRFVQQLRKDANLDIKDRITIRCATASAELKRAIDQWSALIAGETQADALNVEQTDAPPAGDGVFKINGEAIAVAIAR